MGRAAELRREFGDQAALAVCEASALSLDGIESWCERTGVDAHFRRAPLVEVATSAAQHDRWREGVEACAALGRPHEYEPLGEAAVQAVCASPAFGAGARIATNATVHPARLALGLRAALIERGVTIHEGSRVLRLESGRDGVRAHTATATTAATTAVLALNHATAGVPGLRRSLAVASSHVVATEPVPDVLEQAGWTGGEALADARTMLHYMRTTRDGRIVLGWGGGRMGYDARRRRALDSDPQIQDCAAATLRRLFPLLRVAAYHGWGGPIDVSPTRLPFFAQHGERVFLGAGFSGNGVGRAISAGASWPPSPATSAAT